MNKIAILTLCLLFVQCKSQGLYVSIVDPSKLQKNVPSNDKHDRADLCTNVECEEGERCVVINDEAVCECYEDCIIPSDERQRICSSSNKTYESDCHFVRQKCWCNKNDRKCSDLSIINDKLDYYGVCRNIEKCTAKEREIFVGRMKIWLDEVLHILDVRKDLDPKFVSLVKFADEMKAKKVEKYWTAGVIFEFCQLDKSKDRSIQKQEVSLLISSIKSLEHCIQPFLDKIDQNEDDIISEDEWGHALDLSSDDMIILKSYC